MTKIAVIDDWQDAARGATDWTALEKRAEISFFGKPFAGDDDTVKTLADFDIIMSNRERTAFPAGVIDRLPRLRMLSITGARNSLVDFDALARRGIVATKTGFSPTGDSGAAELALALALAAARHIPAGDRAMRSGSFQDGVPVGFVMRGKTVGVIGLGKLGQLMARFCKAMDAAVLAWSPNLTKERAEAAGVEYAAKDDLLARADVVSLHIVLSASTRGLIGAREIGLMKQGAVLVNTSRGPLVDEAALIEALNADRIVAGIDVYDREPLPAGHPLRTAKNTVLMPHVGFCVQETFETFYRQSIENVLAFLDGKPINLIGK